MASARVRLLEVDPDLGRFLSEEELTAARLVVVPTIAVGRDSAPMEEQLREHRAFAGMLLEGMVFERVQVGDQVAMRLLAPGDIISVEGGAPSLLVGQSSASAAPGSELVLLGADLLLAARRWPGLIRGLHQRYVQQAERLVTQLAVCQLPRVDQRLLAMMWLLAESWGRVTPSGTSAVASRSLTRLRAK